VTTKDSFLYPVTPETLHKYAEDIFAPIRRGECVTTVWVPMAGRRMWNKFIIENIRLFDKELPNYDKYLLTYIEPLDLTEESLTGYIRLMAKSFIEVALANKYVKKDVVNAYRAVFNNDQATYSLLLENLKKLLKETTDSGLEVIFFVGEFDELKFANTIFYNNLKSLWSGLYPRLHYIFLLRERVTRQENISKWGELNEAIMQNIIYVPLRSEKDTKYMIDYLSEEYKVKISEAQEVIIRNLCGGHPYMIKVAVRFLARNINENFTPGQLESLLSDYYELKSVARAIFEARGDKEKKVLQLVAEGKKVSQEYDEISTFLRNLGLTFFDKKVTNKLFGELFTKSIVGSEEKKNDSTGTNGDLHINENTGAILVGGKTVEELFTRQEYMILSMFLQKKDKLFTRDEIGEMLWGKESYEKYSDWAIDQLMSKLRRKLKKIGIKSSLITIRGRGYKLVSS